MPPIVPEIFINDVPIQFCEVVKFLGILIDSKLSGKHHFTYVISKCRKALNVMSALAGIWWGSHPQLLMMIYKGIIRSSIDYERQVFQLYRNLTIFEKLQRIQYKAIRIAYGYRQSTPINILLDEAKEPLLHFQPQLQLADSHNSLYSSQLPPDIQNVNLLFLERTQDLRRNAVLFYTDGSKDDSGFVGAGVYSPDLEFLQLRHKLPIETTIFSAEAWAILQALIVIFQLNLEKAIIFSDSKSVI
ncbi:uncharacterized protein [Temnothorax nylanderi]|uniref:uncharacterized protein n=1 Tax=Temnothorax nylanderi TaxID=102681 RepID=UPI003A8B6DC3